MEDDQQFCLRWNNHQSTLIQNFDTLLESGTLVDCTLAAEGKYLKAHKVVLSACSPYFEGLLSEHYDKHPVFILKDVKFKELKAMMDYMYRGEVNINQDQLTALLKAAESLQIKGLSDSRTGGGPSSGVATTAKTETRPAKTASSAVAASSSHDIPHASSGLTIEKNNKVPRQSLQQVSISDLPDDSASPHLRGLSSREGSQSPTRKRKRLRRRSLGNDDTNSMENHEASNSSDVNISAPALGVAPVAEDRTHADPADTVGRSALMQQLTKPADEMLQIPIEKPEPSDELIQPKSEYLDDQESVEELTNLDDDMNDLNDMDPDNSRAGPSHDPSQHGGLAAWHIAGDRSNASVVGAAAGAPGQQDEVFLAAQDAAQAQRDSQVMDSKSSIVIKEEPNGFYEFQNDSDSSEMQHLSKCNIKVLDVTSISLKEMEQLSAGRNTLVQNPIAIMRKRRLRKLQSLKKSPVNDVMKEPELPRPSNAVATVLDQAVHEEDCVKREVYEKVFAPEELDQQLLRPQKIENVTNYLKRKRGRPRKIRKVLEIYPMAEKTMLNGLPMKRKRGRPRKIEDHANPPKPKPIDTQPKPDSQYFREEILMTRLRNKRL